MYRKIVKLLASLKLAVLTLAIIAVLISVGTVVESQYDAWTAKNLVYNSVWMSIAMAMLVINLVAVILDRWPWKPRHAAFIFAHIGIIIIIYGALLTQLFGIDGTVRLTRSTTPTKDVTVQETEINVYRSRTGENYEKVHGEEVNFLKNPLRADKPILIKAKGLEFGIYESIPYGLSQMKVEESDQAQSGGAIRYQLSNMNVSEIDWLVQRNPFERAEKQVGPVFLTFGGLWERTPEINEIRLFQDEKGRLNYALYRKDTNTPNKTGRLVEGENLKTDWMGLEVKILRYLPKAVQKYQVTAMDHPTPMTSPSLRVKANGSESYLVLNDYVKVFTDEYVYLVAYQNKRLPLGFDLSLLSFKKTDYPGTMRAMAYESEVQFDDQKSTISMNEPLKYKGFYIYQASFEQSPTGAATASILSVNRDPGRVWKYLGSLVMCLGIVMLFYFKKRPGKK